MPKASDLKRGNYVAINGAPYVVQHVDVKTPSSRGANTLYKVRFQHVQTRQKLNETYKGEDLLDDIQLERRPCTFSYLDGESYVFMDDEDFTQYSLTKDAIEEQVPYITEGLEGLSALIVDGSVIGVELPSSVVLEIVETTPGIKGASASARTKPATLSTGLVIQVPEYLETGQRVKVNTAEARYMARE